jgi:hypothetical protein
MHHIFVAATIVILFASSAWGQSSDTGPDITRDFLTFCRSNFEPCKKRISVIEIGMNANLFEGKRPCYASFVEGDVLTRSVLEWLTNHPEMHGQKTGTSVVEAIVKLSLQKIDNHNLRRGWTRNGRRIC